MGPVIKRSMMLSLTPYAFDTITRPTKEVTGDFMIAQHLWPRVNSEVAQCALKVNIGFSFLRCAPGQKETIYSYFRPESGGLSFQISVSDYGRC
jgi:hypothetical protein